MMYLLCICIEQGQIYSNDVSNLVILLEQVNGLKEKTIGSILCVICIIVCTQTIQSKASCCWVFFFCFFLQHVCSQMCVCTVCVVFRLCVHELQIGTAYVFYQGLKKINKQPRLCSISFDDHITKMNAKFIHVYFQQRAVEGPSSNGGLALRRHSGSLSDDGC